LLLACTVILSVAFSLATSDRTRSSGQRETDACGTSIAKPGGGRWRCTLVDDFNGSTLDRAIWLPQAGYPAGSPDSAACHADHHANISVSGGALHLTVHPAEAPVPCRGVWASYTSAQVSTYHRFSQEYGRFEARFRTAPATEAGLHEAFWLWPDDRVPSPVPPPASGEIDVAETYSSHPSLAVPFLHYGPDDNGGPVPGLNTAWDCAADRGRFHTYTLEWTSTTLTIEVDGETCLVNADRDPAFRKPYIVLLTATLGVGDNAYRGGPELPATTSVDYVKVWE
jgi:beta-glucanase (GH16 family)